MRMHFFDVALLLLLLLLLPGLAPVVHGQSWNDTGSMHEGRVEHTATLLPDGTVLVAAGKGYDYPPLNSSERYDPATGVWSRTGSLQVARAGHAATLLADDQDGGSDSGFVLVTAGRVDAHPAQGDDTSATPSCEIYDAATGEWTRVADLQDPRTYHTATLLSDGRVLVAGGEYYEYGIGGDFVVLDGCEMFDPATRTWTQVASLHTPQSDHTATLLGDGTVLVAGNGVGEVFDPSTGTWAETAGPMILRRSEHTATLLLDGDVLLAGGNGILYCERYKPSTGVFVPSDPLRTERYFHTATLLPGGCVLVVGGGGGSNALSYTEYYDPTYDRWIAVDSMSTGRSDHTATLLPDGNVLVSGGVGSDVFASAEIFLNDLKL